MLLKRKNVQMTHIKIKSIKVLLLSFILFSTSVKAIRSPVIGKAYRNFKKQKKRNEEDTKKDQSNESKKTCNFFSYFKRFNNF